jgi:hypothetical protein
MIFALGDRNHAGETDARAMQARSPEVSAAAVRNTR